MSEEVLAVVSPSGGRRFLAVGMLATLGALLLYLTFATPPESLGLQAFLLAIGIGSLMLADKVRRATANSIELTAAGLRESTGREICAFENITGVERGPFAFKPSNGFLVRLKKPLGRSWAPGLWWRVGRRIGIGGVTPKSQCKFMADMIAMRLADRNPDS